ncbi:MAG: PAS domain-containing sensor histidine kinase [Deltaproteobacteria bacterium HGW-Deltaproteobacteria-21]|nr:MAG: PAS domain-containing sensor histidine kinase [Deltaproteobacteria bacterium HGW-Deltaproteobacteria-21]
MAKKRRLYWQLFIPYLLIVLLALIAVLLYSSNLLEEILLKQTESDLRSQAILFQEQLRSDLPPDDRTDELCKTLGRGLPTRFTVILPNGRVVGDSDEDPARMDNHLDRPEVATALTEPVGVSTRFSNTLGKRMMYLAMPLRESGMLFAIVRASVPIESVYGRIKTVQNRILLGGGIVAFLAVIAGFLVYRRVRRPLRQIQEGAMAFARGEFQPKLPLPDTEEMAQVAETLNRMAAELQQRIGTITQQRNELETVLSSMAEGVFGVDRDERIMGMNQAAGRILGCDPLLTRGKTIQEAFRISSLQDFVKKALAGEERLEEDFLINIYGERERALNVHGTPLRDESGNRTGILVVMHDITELRRLENIRRDFVANASHEIRTPLTAIKGFVETLRDGAMQNPEDADRFLSIIQKHVDRLAALVEDLLSLSRIERETERDEIILEEQAIQGVLESAVQLCRGKGEARNIRIELVCSETLKAKINPPLLEQAVMNLLDNAINASANGKAIRVEAGEQETEVLVHVKDLGLGIEKGNLDRLFERFYRVDKARSRKRGGTGLGLAIVKHIMEAHKGRVTVESRPGAGSAFTLHLQKVSPEKIIQS